MTEQHPVLIVDDDTMMVLMLRPGLASAGHAVVSATTWGDAQQKVLTLTPSLRRGRPRKHDRDRYESVSQRVMRERVREPQPCPSARPAEA